MMAPLILTMPPVLMGHPLLTGPPVSATPPVLMALLVLTICSHSMGPPVSATPPVSTLPSRSMLPPRSMVSPPQLMAPLLSTTPPRSMTLMMSTAMTRLTHLLYVLQVSFQVNSDGNDVCYKINLSQDALPPREGRRWGRPPWSRRDHCRWTKHRGVQGGSRWEWNGEIFCKPKQANTSKWNHRLVPP